MEERIREIVEGQREELIAFREEMHRNPELSFEEYETAKRISAQLDRWGISHDKNVVDTGIVGHIGHKGACVALRADIDALPIQEENDTSYTSRIPGKMHACGHDVHTTCLLGAALALRTIAEQLNGQIKLIFQPGEEKLPGGASQMIRAGVLEDPRPALIIGQHVHPPMETGVFGFRPGRYMASADEIYIDVTAEGGHAALPHNTGDAILAASAIIQGLQQVVSRRADPVIPAVLTIGSVNSKGGATNVLPPLVQMEGTFRCMDEAQRHRLWDEMENCVNHIAHAYHCQAQLTIKKGYPCLFNDEMWTEVMMDVARQSRGESRIELLDIRMTAEDFSFYSQEIPAVFYRLGVRNESKGIIYPVHHPRFDADPEAIIEGAIMMATLAYHALEKL